MEARLGQPPWHRRRWMRRWGLWEPFGGGLTRLPVVGSGVRQAVDLSRPVMDSSTSFPPCFDLYVTREQHKETGGEEVGDSQIDIHPAVNPRLKVLEESG